MLAQYTRCKCTVREARQRQAKKSCMTGAQLCEVRKTVLTAFFIAEGPTGQSPEVAKLPLTSLAIELLVELLQMWQAQGSKQLL